MNRKIQFTLIFFILAAVMLACSVTPPPVGSSEPSGMVETAVAGTLQAIMPGSGGDTPGITPVVPEVLPYPLYFMQEDPGGIAQVFRLDPNGTTLAQVTHEVVDVGAYSVAPDGRLAYVANNQLLLENSDGSGRVILLDGGPLDTDNPYIDRVSAPVWSPDGRSIAFGYRGLNFYDIAAGSYINRVADVIESTSGMLFPRELFFPDEYSPDGRLLLVDIGWYEGGSYGIFDVTSGFLVKPSMQGILCCVAEWAPDNGSVYFASSTMGMIESGLWRFDTNGTVTTLIPGQAADGTWNFADHPLLAPDGQLYFFFGNYPEIPSGHTPLMLVRSAPDGITGRTLLLPDTFSMLNDALWAPDGSLVVTVEAASETMWQGGQIKAVYLDGRPARILVGFGYDLKWGH